MLPRLPIVQSSTLLVNHASHSSPCIIDSGASDRMTGTVSFFSSLSTYSSSKNVLLANDTLSPVSGQGKVQVSHSLLLSPVLYVTQIPCNLLSTTQLTKALNYNATSYPTHEFQDLYTRKMIGG